MTATDATEEVVARFGEFSINLATLELSREGRPVSLPLQSARVLRCLLSRPGQLVTRQELVSEVWGDTLVDYEQGLNSCIRRVRQALGDRADEPRFVETLPRLGYRFLLPVSRELSAAPRRNQDGLGQTSVLRHRASQKTSAPFIGSALVLAVLTILVAVATGPEGRMFHSSERDDSAVVAVLALRNLTGSKEVEWIGEALKEELVARVASLSPERPVVVSLAVASRETGALTASQAELRKEADYLVVGSLRTDGSSMRITMKLVRSSDSSCRWVGSFDTTATGFRAQEEIAHEVARAVEEELSGR